MRVFPDDGARRAGRPGPAGLMSELQRSETNGWRTIFRSLDPTWTVMGLAPGTYRLVFPARLDEEGNVVKLDEKPHNLRVKAGEVLETETVLRHVSGALIAAGVVTTVAVAVLLHDWLKDHDPPLPPPPPLPPQLVAQIFYVGVDIALNAPWREVPVNGVPGVPVVTSHFPENGALVVAPRVRVAFALATPLVGGELKASGVTVLGEKSGLIPGSTSYDGAHAWIVWSSSANLPRGDTYHVTLEKDAVETASGDELPQATSFTFRTAP